MPEDLKDRKVVVDRESLAEIASDFRSGSGSDEGAYYELMGALREASNKDKEALGLTSAKEIISETNSGGQNIDQSQRVEEGMVLGNTSDDFWGDAPVESVVEEPGYVANEHGKGIRNTSEASAENPAEDQTPLEPNINDPSEMTYLKKPDDALSETSAGDLKMEQTELFNPNEKVEPTEIIPGHIYDAQIIGEENGYYQVAIRTIDKPQILQVDFGVTAPMQNAIGSDGEVWAEIKILDKPKVIETKNLAWAGFTCKAEYIRDITQDKSAESGTDQAVVEKPGDNGSKAADTATTDTTDPNVNENAAGHQDIESKNEINLWPYFNENAKWRVTSSTNDQVMVGVTDDQGSRLLNWTGHNIGEVLTLIEPLDPNNLENTNLIFEVNGGQHQISVALHDLNKILLPAKDGVDEGELQEALDEIIEKAIGHRPDKAAEQDADNLSEVAPENKDGEGIAQHLLGASRNILARIAKGYNVNYKHPNDKHPNQDYIDALNKPTTDSVAQVGLPSDFRDVRGKLDVAASESQAANNNKTEVTVDNEQVTDSIEPIVTQNVVEKSIGINIVGNSSLAARPKRGTMGVTNYSVPNEQNRSTNEGGGNVAVTSQPAIETPAGESQTDNASPKTSHLAVETKAGTLDDFVETPKSSDSGLSQTDTVRVEDQQAPEAKEERLNLHEWVTYGPEGIIDDNMPQSGVAEGSVEADHGAGHINFFNDGKRHDTGPAGDDVEADISTLKKGDVKPTEIVTYDLGGSSNEGRNMGEDNYNRSAITVSTVNGKYANDAMDGSNEEGDYHVVVSNPDADHNPLEEDEALALLQKRRAAAEQREQRLEDESMAPIRDKPEAISHGPASTQPVHFAAEMVLSPPAGNNKITITNIEPASIDATKAANPQTTNIQKDAVGIPQMAADPQPTTQNLNKDQVVAGASAIEPAVQAAMIPSADTETVPEMLSPKIDQQQLTPTENNDESLPGQQIETSSSQPTSEASGSGQVNQEASISKIESKPGVAQTTPGQEVGGTVDITNDAANTSSANSIIANNAPADTGGNWLSRLLRGGSTGSGANQTRSDRMKALSKGEADAQKFAKVHES